MKCEWPPRMFACWYLQKRLRVVKPLILSSEFAYHRKFPPPYQMPLNILFSLAKEVVADVYYAFVWLNKHIANSIYKTLQLSENNGVVVNRIFHRLYVLHRMIWITSEANILLVFQAMSITIWFFCYRGICNVEAKNNIECNSISISKSVLSQRLQRALKDVKCF